MMKIVQNKIPSFSKNIAEFLDKQLCLSIQVNMLHNMLMAFNHFWQKISINVLQHVKKNWMFTMLIPHTDLLSNLHIHFPLTM